jgi:hypothetical protein
MLGRETKLGTRLECLAGFSGCADQAVKQDFCKKFLPIIEFITTVRRSFLLCRLTQTGESPSFLRWHRKSSLTRRGGATHRRSKFRLKMNTILIFSLIILLFGFDSSSRNESIRFQR